MESRKILIVDDNLDIHRDFEKIFQNQTNDDQEITEIEFKLFGSEPVPNIKTNKERLGSVIIQSAFQGEDAIKMIDEAEKKSEPYSLVFMDVRMPPGMDGIQTVSKIWERYPETEIALCTAYSDYSDEEMIRKLGSDRFFFLIKPIHPIMIRQIAYMVVSNRDLRRDLKELTSKRG